MEIKRPAVVRHSAADRLEGIGSDIQHMVEQIDQTDSQIHQTTPARKFSVVVPRLVRPPGVVEYKFGRMYGSKITPPDEFPELLYCLCLAIGEVDTEQQILFSCCLDHPPGLLLIATYRFLTKNGDTSFEGLNALLRMQCTRRGNDHPVELLIQK